MSNLTQHTFDAPIAVLDDGIQRRPQLHSKIGRHTDGIPVQIRVPIMESLSLPFGQQCLTRNLLKAINQKTVSFHLAEFDLRIESRTVSVPRVGGRFRIVPVQGSERGDENRPPEVLTFGNSKLQRCDPFSLTRVWPLVTTCAVDASSRCSKVAWLYSPDLGTFPAEPPLSPGALGNFCFALEKSPLCEVDDDHRT